MSIVLSDLIEKFSLALSSHAMRFLQSRVDFKHLLIDRLLILNWFVAFGKTNFGASCCYVAFIGHPASCPSAFLLILLPTIVLLLELTLLLTDCLFEHRLMPFGCLVELLLNILKILIFIFLWRYKFFLNFSLLLHPLSLILLLHLLESVLLLLIFLLLVYQNLRLNYIHYVLPESQSSICFLLLSANILLCLWLSVNVMIWFMVANFSYRLERRL